MCIRDSHTTTGVLSDGVARSARAQFGPAGNYSTVNNGSGLGHGFFHLSAGAIIRGGNWNDPFNGGIFHVWLGYSPTQTFATVGFRCVYNGE